MKALVYFQPKELKDIFEATRLRKTIKGALEITDIQHTSNMFDEFDIAHFMSINDEAKINECKEKNIPVVFSAMYCENDPSAKIISVDRKNNRKLKEKAVRVLNNVDLVLVPSERAKKFLIEQGICSKIEVLIPGVNISRFELLHEEERELCYRYFGIKRDKKIIVTVGDYENKKQIDDIIDLSRRCTNFIFIFIGIAKRKTFLKAKIRKLLKLASKNLIFSPIVRDDIYRSLLVEASCFLYLDDNKFDSMTIYESMAARTPVVVFGETHGYLIERNLCVGTKDKIEATSLILKTLETKESDIVDYSYDFASKHSLTYIGEKLKNYYVELINLKGETK